MNNVREKSYPTDIGTKNIFLCVNSLIRLLLKIKKKKTFPFFTFSYLVLMLRKRHTHNAHVHVKLNCLFYSIICEIFHLSIYHSKPNRAMALKISKSQNKLYLL